MLRPSRPISSFLLCALASSLILSACGSYNALGGGTQQRPSGWTESSHSKNTPPNYAVVFEENAVQRLDIDITPAHWQAMQDDMQTLFGDGQNAGGANGGGGPPGGAPPNRPEVTLDEDGNPVFPEGGGPPGERPEGGGPGGGGGLGDEGENPMWQEATLRFKDQTWQHVGIRYKGNSSLRSSWGHTQKLPFRLNFDYFEDSYPEIDDQRFFGFKKLTFSSGFTDDSLIREKVVADIFRTAGIPAARTAFYRVYVNYGEGEKYLGLYTMVEPPDTPLLNAQFGQDTGNLYKPSGNGARFGSFDADSFAKENNETAADWSDIQAVFNALHADRSDAGAWRQGLEKVFDVPHFLRYLAINTLIQNWDTYGRMEHNYYLYTDPNTKKVRWIPWDNNMALSEDPNGERGIGQGAPPQNTVQDTSSTEVAQTPPTNSRPGGRVGGGRGALSLPLSSEEVGEDWPLIRYLIDDPVYNALYREELQRALNGAFAKVTTMQRYQTAHDLIRPYVTGENGETSESTLLSSPEAFVPALQTLFNHLESRHEAAEAFLKSES